MISEPMTMLTDYILAIFCIIFWNRLSDKTKHPYNWWSYSFFGAAVAAITGGTVHGLAEILQEKVLDIFWYITLFSVLATNIILLIGLSQWSITNPKMLNMAYVIAIVKFLVSSIIVIINPLFLTVAIDYGLTMILLIFVRLIIWYRQDWQSPDLIPILSSCAIAFLVGLVYFVPISPSPEFNHNDLAHILQIGVMYALSKL